MSAPEPLIDLSGALPPVLDVTPLIAESNLPDDDPNSLLDLLTRIAHRLGCDVVPRGESAPQPTETVIHQ